MIRMHKLYFCIFLSVLIGAIMQMAEAVTIPDIPEMPSTENESDTATNPYGQAPAAIPQIPETQDIARSDAAAANLYGQTPAATPSNASPQNPMKPSKTIKKKKKMSKKAKRKKGCGCKSYISVGKKKKPYYCGH